MLSAWRPIRNKKSIMTLRGFLPLRITWLMLCAVLFGAAAPSVSHVLATANPANAWVEVCSVGGPKRLALNLPTKPAMPTANAAHCPFCLLEHHVPSLPPATGGLRIASQTGSAVRAEPPVLLAIIKPVRLTGQSRAPPVLA